jgi:hypothetical protein
MTAVVLCFKWQEAFAPATWSNWVLVGITLGATIAAFWTLRLLGKQTEVALLSSQAVINSERAWVEISLGPRWSTKEPETKLCDSMKHSVLITNHGRTVARVESYSISCDAVEGSFSMDKLHHQTRNFNVLLGAGESANLAILDINDLPDWDSIENQSKTGTYHILVRYRDVLDRRQKHETSGIFVYNTRSENLDRLSLYNLYL